MELQEQVDYCKVLKQSLVKNIELVSIWPAILNAGHLSKKWQFTRLASLRYFSMMQTLVGRGMTGSLQQRARLQPLSFTASMRIRILAEHFWIIFQFQRPGNK